jgi:hypothetical protein
MYTVQEFLGMMDQEREKMDLEVKKANGVISKEEKIREEETRKLNKKLWDIVKCC